MKITRLRLAGFGPYKTEQQVDFTTFDADGIFLITGKTGAGKSSILDAICFALYGSVPRFDGSELRLRSDHCDPDDPSFVEVEFTLAAETYRLHRTPAFDKPKKRGAGTTPAKPEARLDRLGAAGWEGIAAKPVDVAHELDLILPLKKDQFLQVILLAQNRFQRFLLAKTDDRLTVLRTLFGTLRFQQLEAVLISRRKVLDDELAAVNRDIAGLVASALRQFWRDGDAAESDSTDSDSTDSDSADTDGTGDDRAGADRAEAPEAPAVPTLEWFLAGLAAVENRLAAATGRADAASAALAAAARDCDAAEDRRRRQDRRDTAARALASLDHRAEQVLGARRTLRLAERAARVWPQVRARTDAEADLTASTDAESIARAAWLRLAAETHPDAAAAPGAADLGAADLDAAALNTAAPDTAALDGIIDDRLRQLGALADALLDEARLPDLDASILQAEQRSADQAEALEAAHLLVLALPERIGAATDALATATLGAARLPEAEAARARAEAALTAAEDRRRLETELVGVHRAEREAVAENTAAAVAYQDLVDRRLGGFAVELAAGLVDGSPCSVCGATEHPAPQTGDTDPVTEADLAAARRLMTGRQAAVDDARHQSQTVATLLTEARTRAGSGDADALDATLRAAEEAVVEAVGHRDRVPGLEAELTRLRADQAAAQTALAPLQLARDEAAVHLAEQRTERDGISSRVRGQRAGFDSVTDRAGGLQAELAAARALAAALAASAAARRAAEAATDTLARQLGEEGFTDEAGAVQARLAPDEVRRHELAIRSYDDERAAAAGVLAEPGLAGLPDDPIDLAPLKLARDTADTARDEALARRESLRERVTALEGIAQDAGDRFALAADLLATQGQVRQLAAVVHGDDPNTKRMKLETYVLAAQLEEIIIAANNRLRTMTGGRYTLEHDDALQYRGTQAGLGLAIRDEHTGRARATHSLSGGETFLASLALALGLAEVVSNQAGGITLDTLFVDEGFGSLDAETLETAMSTLDSLRAGGVGSSRVDLQACKLEYSIVSPK